MSIVQEWKAKWNDADQARCKAEDALEKCRAALAQCDTYVRQQDVLLWQRQQAHEATKSELDQTRTDMALRLDAALTERDTARADLAGLSADYGKLLKESNVHEKGLADAQWRLGELRIKDAALQAKVSQAVALLEAQQAISPQCTITRTLEALRSPAPGSHEGRAILLEHLRGKDGT